jgi:hypothetical protein
MSRTFHPIGSPPYWDGEYWKAVSVVRELPGKVICPEDPTIPFYARGYVGLNVYSENDTHLHNGIWPDRPTPAVMAEIRAADYVVDHCEFIEVGESLFRELGFEPVKDVPLDPKCYRVWRRGSSGSDRSAKHVRGDGAAGSPQRAGHRLVTTAAAD